MRIMSRDFSLKEKLLLLLLGILLIGIVYYYFVDEPVRTGLILAQQKEQEIQTNLSVVHGQVERLSGMKQEIDSIMSDGTASRMESYNNVKAEIQLLNDILNDSIEYNITFAEVTRDENQIRRDVMIRYTAENYEIAKSLMQKLSESEYRCLIGDIAIASQKNNLWEDVVSVSLTATFYETMVGGVEDEGLPKASNEFEGEDLRQELEYDL